MWYKDFSNILAILAVIAGTILLVCGDENVGEKGWLLIAYTFGVTTKTIGTKVSGNKTIKVVGSLLVACLFLGCITPKIPPNTAELMEKICLRHDVYIENDDTLDGLEVETYLNSTKIVRMYIWQNSDLGEIKVEAD